MSNKPFESAQEAFDWITGARWKGEKRGLQNTLALLEALGRPDKSMGRVVHVAGTNGKGSTCAMLNKALIECGHNVGLFTSPYLCRFNERLRVNGRPIADGELVSVAERVRAAAQALADTGVCATTFEILTCMACVWFSEKHVDYSIMEVGMGGRLDPTNALAPAISLIAAIGMDHMARLGDTLVDIAGEKAGIIKPGTPAVALTQNEEVMRVFREVARGMRAPLFETQPASVTRIHSGGAEFVTELPRAGLVRQEITLPGAHQVGNACLALTALDLLGADIKRAARGLYKTRWPGRLEWIGSTLIDGAHNPQGARALGAYARAYLSDRRVCLLTGMMQDKQLEKVAEALSPIAGSVVCTQVNWPRAASAAALKQIYGDKAHAEPDIKKAFELARSIAGEDGVVIVAGSIYLAGDVRNMLMPFDDGSL